MNFGNKIENYNIDVFVPDGLADKYKNIFATLTDLIIF